MLYIRVDMNDKIATGHVMRCLAVADAARMKGEDTTFILADWQAVELLRQRGYEFVVLHSQWDDMEGELFELQKVIDKYQMKRLLIDSYQVTERYLKALKEYVEIFYIDDLNAFHYPVDAMICYANYWEKFQYEAHYKNERLYLGTQYMPLKKAFLNCEKKQIKPQIENILLLSGGTDPYDILDNILQRMERDKYQKIEVICGIYYPKYKSLCQKYDEHKNISIRQGVPNIEDYMREADLAVSAGGTTLYELCAVGTPAISYAIADNQLENVKKFEEDRLIAYAGDIRKDHVIDHIIDYLKIYDLNWQIRQERSLKMQKLVDGKGALRIANALMD